MVKQKIIPNSPNVPTESRKRRRKAEREAEMSQSSSAPVTSKKNAPRRVSQRNLSKMSKPPPTRKRDQLVLSESDSSTESNGIEKSEKEGDDKEENEETVEVEEKEEDEKEEDDEEEDEKEEDEKEENDEEEDEKEDEETVEASGEREEKEESGEREEEETGEGDEDEKEESGEREEKEESGEREEEEKSGEGDDEEGDEQTEESDKRDGDDQENANADGDELEKEHAAEMEDNEPQQAAQNLFEQEVRIANEAANEAGNEAANQAGAANQAEQILEEQQDRVPPVILRYKLETVMDSVGSSSSTITFRNKIGHTVGNLNQHAKGKHGGIGSLIVRSGLDHFMKLIPDNWENGCGNLLHFFLLRRIKCNKKNAFWFLIGNKPIRFGMREFCLVTGLKCHPLPSGEAVGKALADGMEFVEKVKGWVKREREREAVEMVKEMIEEQKGRGKAKGKAKIKGKEEIKKKPSKIKSSNIFPSDLLKIIDLQTKEFTVEDKSRCAAMYLVHCVALGEQEINNVSTDYLSFTVNPEFFATFPWGRLSYLKLLLALNKDFEDMKINQPSGPLKYPVQGFFQAFLAWAFEAVDKFGIDLGFRSVSNPDVVPRILRWNSRGSAKIIHISKMEERIAGNQVTCFPMLRPSTKELESDYYRAYEDLPDDEKDPTIDRLEAELGDVVLLRPEDGVEPPVDQEEAVEREDIQFMEDTTEQAFPSPQMPSSSRPMPSSSRTPRTATEEGDLVSRVAALEEEVQELRGAKKVLEEYKEKIDKISSDVSFLANLKRERKAREKRKPARQLSPNYIRLSGKKRNPPKEDRKAQAAAIAKKLKVGPPESGSQGN